MCVCVLGSALVCLAGWVVVMARSLEVVLVLLLLLLEAGSSGGFCCDSGSGGDGVMVAAR